MALAEPPSNPLASVNRPLLAAGKPETRKYKGIFVVADAEIGLESNVVEATARP